MKTSGETWQCLRYHTLSPPTCGAGSHKHLLSCENFSKMAYRHKYRRRTALFYLWPCAALSLKNTIPVSTYTCVNRAFVDAHPNIQRLLRWDQIPPKYQGLHGPRRRPSGDGQGRGEHLGRPFPGRVPPRQQARPARGGESKS